MRLKLGLFLSIAFLVGLQAIAFASGTAGMEGESLVPYPLSLYGDESGMALWDVLVARIKAEPFNLIASIIFCCAILHTFMSRQFELLAKRLQARHEAAMKARGETNPDVVCYKAEICHFLGEIEAVFGIWVIPLMLSIMVFHGWSSVTTYLDATVVYNEPMFVVIIMAIASTRPVLIVSERMMAGIAAIGKSTPAAWWFSILTVGPILGSFITEPAAMTISALLLAKQFYKLEPSLKLRYATIGLLFVNISVGGTLTHFAAPPVLMVASVWDWDSMFMLTNFGWKSAIGIGIGNIVYYCIFRKEFFKLAELDAGYKKNRREFVKDMEVQEVEKVPLVVTGVHMLFLVWTVFTMHYPTLFVGGFLFFLAFTRVTLHHQYQLQLRSPMLVGFFLAGLVTHGTLQQWWIEPVLSRLTEVPLFLSATILTAFNDNAMITFLATLVPDFANNISLQKAVVAGAVAGGGLTVIANAPNPAGVSILSKHFPEGLSPGYIVLSALIPTVIVSCALMLLP